jgi:hypothetical protein
MVLNDNALEPLGSRLAQANCGVWAHRPSGVLPPLIIGEREIDMFVKGGALYEQLGLFRQMKCGSAEI